VSDAQRLNEEGLDLYASGRFAEALTRFESAFVLAPTDAVIRRNAAEASASLGNEALEASDWNQACRRYARAAQLESEESRFQLGLALAREGGGEDPQAEAAYRMASQLAPKDARPLVRLGALLFRKNNLPEAVAVLEKAAALAPDDAALAALLAKARKDLGFEGNLSEAATSLFEVVFDGIKNADASQQVVSMLLSAQTEVGTDLNLSQRAKVRVVLYTQREYAEVTSAPEWAAAHFDGKIRLPVKDMDRREKEIRGTLYHEYVHALLHENLPDCPSWLHEGLAQAVECTRVLGQAEEASRVAPLARLKEGEWIPLKDLERPISGLGDAGRIRLAYAESLSFVRYLEGRFGPSAMQVFLSRWKESPHKPYRQVFKDAYGSELEELEKDWQAAGR